VPKSKPSVMLKMMCLLSLLWSIPVSTWRWITNRDYFNHIPNPTFKDVYGVEWELARYITPYTYWQTGVWKTHKRIRWLLDI
jgi:hypothetical protein